MDFSQMIYAAIEFILYWDASDRIPMKVSRQGESTHVINCLQEW